MFDTPKLLNKRDGTVAASNIMLGMSAAVKACSVTPEVMVEL